MEKEIKGGEIMWFNILKEDGDELWDNRTRHYFVKALEGIFDEVETNFAAANNNPYDHHVITIKHKWWNLEKWIIKIAEHDIRFQETEWDWIGEYPYKNYTELLDKLKEIDGKLTKKIPAVKDWEAREIVRAVMEG
tara:strand:+ start:413 stop:820 length:408 start_codon:yes stop_codon:yes gene_type:complete